MLGALLFVLAAEPPPGLQCLGKYYLGQPVQLDGGWAWALPDAGLIPWRANGSKVTDAGAARDAGAEDDEEDETTPDLEQVFATPYLAGPIVPVTGDAGIEEPGRARVEQLFSATYGGSRAEVRKHLGRIHFFGVRYAFHERAVPAMERVVARLDAALKADPKLKPFLTRIGGTWEWRTIARSKSLSTHSWGIAIDLNVDRGYYWRWQRPKKPLKWRNVVPQAVVDAFEAEGFIWGGRWIHYDTMHFEYRPELLDPACRGADAGTPARDGGE